MNERIKLLAEQTGESIPEFHFGDWNIPNEFIQKFAELIVRECCDVLYDNELGGYQVNYVLKEHFGVEEPEQSAADRILSTIRKRN